MDKSKMSVLRKLIEDMRSLEVSDWTKDEEEKGIPTDEVRIPGKETVLIIKSGSDLEMPDENETDDMDEDESSLSLADKIRSRATKRLK